MRPHTILHLSARVRNFLFKKMHWIQWYVARRVSKFSPGEDHGAYFADNS
ncbi:MAG: hypothetical protein OEQ53_10065 [Saprospiraceae bacterium]|nr:hypothetical protein [Saprospiraceae bacterium]